MKDGPSARYDVIHIAETDGGGGATMAAFKLHTALRRAGINSGMVVAGKQSNDPTVMEVRHGRSPISYLRRRALRETQKRRLRAYRETKSRTLEMFTQAKGMYGHDLVKSLPAADIYTLHWTDRLVDCGHLFKSVPAGTSFVWRMPDMNAMTGGCHYAWECRRFEDRCGKCPQLGSTRDDDLSREVFLRKQAAYASLDPDRTRFVAPSRWLQGEARRSSLLRSFEIVHIPTGVDCNVFKPGDSGTLRRRHGLPEDAPIVLFVAQSVTNYRKGFDLLIDALTDVSARTRCVLAAIGDAPDDKTELGVPFHSLGTIEDQRHLAEIYSAVDLFVLPAREENLPNVVLEAMACGTPTIAFDTGGISELVRHNETGLLVPREDASALAQAVQDLLGDPERVRSMGRACRELAETEFSIERMAGRYRELYECLAEPRRVVAR